MPEQSESRGRLDGRLRLTILGAAAGGGFPQWNCHCDICRLAWNGDARVSARTQSSIAVTGDGVHWLLVNASPDLRQQILSTPELAAGRHLSPDDRRGSPIVAVLVTNGDVDHVAGLLTLRERQALTLYGTAGVLDVIDANPIFNVLARDAVARVAVPSGTPFEPVPGLEVELFPVPGKVPLYLEGDVVDVGAIGDMTTGIRLTAGGRTAYYIPGCAAVDDALRNRLRNADLLLFDGTVFTDDEMAAAGVGAKTGRRMGHVPISGAGGSLDAFSDLSIGARVYVHINNTNPILVEGSAERDCVEAEGWMVAHDGLELVP